MDQVLVLALAAWPSFLWWRFTRARRRLRRRGEQRLGAVHRLLPALARRVRPGHPPGDQLADNIKNYDVGTVVSAQAVPCQSLILDQVNGEYVLADVDGYEDVLVTVGIPLHRD